MSQRSSWLILVGAVLLLIVPVYIASSRQSGSSDHASTSDAADGTSALRSYAAALGHPVTALGSTFETPPTAGLMFVFTPDQPYSADQARAMLSWIQNGGILVYANEGSDPELDQQLGLVRTQQATYGGATAAGPDLGGVHTVSGSDVVGVLDPQPDQVVILRSGGGDPIGLREWLGRGQAFLLSDPLELCNENIARTDNGRLAADIMALAPGDPVVFDEFHHAAFGGSEPGTFDIVRFPWGQGLTWAVVVVFIGLAWRGRRFGPHLPRVAEGHRSTTEHVEAVARMLRRARGRTLTARMLDEAASRAVAARVGIHVEPGTDLAPLLASRHPDLARSWSEARAALARADESEGTLLAAAQLLHQTAHPVPVAAGAQSSRAPDAINAPDANKER